MKIDNSRAASFRTCPWMYYEQYVRGGSGIEPIPFKEGYTPLQFGDRVHQLLEEHYKGERLYDSSTDDVLETEAQMMLEMYKAKYPVEPFEVVGVERTFDVALPDFCPNCYQLINYEVGLGPGEDLNLMRCEACAIFFPKGRHSLVGKMDLIVSPPEGVLDIIDHKTEKRGGKNNLPQKWGSKDQASLYLWALKKMFPHREMGRFIVNILTRQSDKGQVQPTFPERQILTRNQKDLDCAVRDIVVVADTIERYTSIFQDNEWPANREECYGWYYCDYYPLHRYGEDVSEILKYKFQPRKEYLHLAGVPIIQ